MKIYIEKLTLCGLLKIFVKLLQIYPSQFVQGFDLSYIDGTPRAIALLQLIATLFKWEVSRLSFELKNIREEGSGDLIRLCIPYNYLWNIKEQLEEQYPEIFQTSYKDNSSLFIEKCALSPTVLSMGSLSRAIFLSHVIEKDMKTRKVDSCLFFLFDHAWKKPVQIYAKTLGIQNHYLTHFYPISQLRSKQVDSEKFPQLFKNYIKELGFIYAPKGFLWIINIWEQLRWWRVTRKKINLKDKSGKIAVFGKGALHFENDGLFSDIFFTFQSSLTKNRLLLLRIQGTKNIIKHLNRYNISYCCTTPPQHQIECINYYSGPRRFQGQNYRHFEQIDRLSSLEKRWLKYQHGEYLYIKAYWTEFTHQQNVKIFHTWNKFNVDHIAIADAMRETGGVMSIWQLAYEELPSVETTMATDILFSFSNRWPGNIEKKRSSKISYHVSTGFLGVNYELLRPKALELRQQLHAKGVQKIVACFDENSLDDSRWNLGHKIQQQHYGLLLEKILEHPWLGVIFKPKQPRTLRKRLGAIADLLEEAEQTGRCLVLGTSGLYASNIPPVLAGLAADVAIQGDMNAGTTALECALAGIPTLSVDLEGYRRSRLYELGEGKVVFRNYEGLWETLQEHWNSPAGVPGLGDWSPLLDEMDSFRDGRGAERMGTYLHWLMNGFENGLNREEILADTAEKYTSKWGYDKIISV